MPELELVVRKDVYVPMRDGVHLAADLYLPAGPGSFPTLVTRSPYGKDGGVSQATPARARRLAASGYAVLVQDCRGSGNSEGEYHYYYDDADDGHDTVEWVAQQPWCSGRVGFFGTSYSANAGYLLAPTQPKGLAAMVCGLGTSSNYLDGRWRGGVWHVSHGAHWAQLVEANTGPKPFLEGGGDEATVARRRRVALDRARKTVERMRKGQANPLSTTFLLDSYRHNTLDDYWRRQAIDDKYDRTTVPTIHVGGWYDQFERGNIQNYLGMKSNPNAGPQMLIMGGWFHAAIEVPFIQRLEEAWFDYWVKGEENDVVKDALEAPVRIFVVGADPSGDGPQEGRWRKEREWPLASSKYTRYYMRGQKSGSAASPNDGSLSTDPPGDEAPDVLPYDPNHPELPGSIGFRSLAVGANNPGSDQRRDEASGHVLTYTTLVLEQDVEITGPITLELYASGTAVDQDWVSHLTDVFPDGTSWLRTDGILKASHRRSHSNPEPLTPGDVYKLEIEVWPTSQVFRRGHRIRLDVMNTSFPKLEPCPYASTNRVYHDQEHPSCIVLPIIPPDGGGIWAEE